MGLGIDREDMTALGNALGQHLRAAIDQITGPGVVVTLDLTIASVKVQGTVEVKRKE